MTLQKRRAYFLKKNKIHGNFNFHDIIIQYYDKHLVIEGGWDEKFIPLFKNEIDALSIIGDVNDFDISNIFTYAPKIKQIFINCNNIINAESFSLLKDLVYLSIICKKNRPLTLQLPKKLKTFIIKWRSKYEIHELPLLLEYLSVESSNNVNWENLISNLKFLLKIEFIACNIKDGDKFLSLPKIRYFSAVSCKNLVFTKKLENKSLKYIYLKKVFIKDIEWVKKLIMLDILILENCGEIKSLSPLQGNTEIRGLFISGDSKISDSDLSVLESLINLKNLFIIPHRHYTHKTIVSWDWINFNEASKKLFIRIR